MNTIENPALEAKILDVQATTEAEVNAISDLTPEQKAKVIVIAVAYAKNHAYQIPNISGIANHIRSSK